jgi:hypothetical protein
MWIVAAIIFGASSWIRGDIFPAQAVPALAIPLSWLQLLHSWPMYQYNVSCLPIQMELQLIYHDVKLQ